MNARFHLKPMEYIGAPDSKQQFNRDLFTTVAPKYNLVTKLLSFGRDRTWKRRMIAYLPPFEAPVCVDLACGTGDITRMLAERYPDGKITGLDLTPEMLDIADRRTDAFNISYVEGSMAELPFATNSTHVVTGGYALRNAPDLDQTIDEIARILRPGAFAAFLDFSKPANKAGQAIARFLLKGWGGLWGLLLHGNPDVYGYIADSLKLFPDRTVLRERFAKRGFTLHASHRFFGGLLEAVVFKKEEPHGD